MATTLVIFTEFPDQYPKIALLNGDLRQLNSIYVNASDSEELEKRILELFYINGALRRELFIELPISTESSPLMFDFVIHCGFAM